MSRTCLPFGPYVRAKYVRKGAAVTGSLAIKLAGSDVFDLN